MYSLSDFSDSYFNFDYFSYYNKNGEGVGVVFPIYMHSYVKFDSLSYCSCASTLHPCPQDYHELLHIIIVKHRLS